MSAEAIPWAVERGVGTYQASKIHRLGCHKACGDGGRGIIACVGAGGSADDANFPGSLGGATSEWPLDTAAKFQPTADASDLLPFLVLGHDHEYGNASARTRIDNAISWAQTTGRFAAGGVDGWGVSGGTHMLLQYAIRNPGVFRTLVLHLPLVDVQALYDFPLFQAEITAALGSPIPAADEPIRRINDYRALFQKWDMNVLIVYGGADPLTPPEQAEEFILGTGAESVEMPGKGHTIDPDDFDADVIAEFFLRHRGTLRGQGRAAIPDAGIRTVRNSRPSHLWDLTGPDKTAVQQDSGDDATQTSGLTPTNVHNGGPPGRWDGGNAAYFDGMAANGGTTPKLEVATLAIWTLPIVIEFAIWRDSDNAGEGIFQAVSGGDLAGVYLGGDSDSAGDSVFWAPQGILGTSLEWDDAAVPLRQWSHVLIGATSSDAELFVNGASRGSQIFVSALDAGLTGAAISNFTGYVAYLAVHHGIASSAGWARLALPHARALGAAA